MFRGKSCPPRNGSLMLCSPKILSTWRAPKTNSAEFEIYVYIYKLNYHKLNMKEWFIKQGYPESVIDKEMEKVRFSEQDQKSKKVE